jgi:tetratricopeptide (TPR) repeat protein/ribosomal protein L40E
MASPRSCPSCGARVADDADRCDLCGESLGAGTDAAEPEPSPGSEDAGSPSEAVPRGADPEPQSHEDDSAPQGVYCNQCGWENPADANFCSQCGTELQEIAREAGGPGSPSGTRPVAANLPGPPASEASADASSASDASSEESEEGEYQLMSQQVLLVVGSAVLALVTLFFITVWSQSQTWGDNSGEAAATAPAQNGSPASPGTGEPTGGPTGGAASFGGATPDLATLVSQNDTELPPDLAERTDSLEAQLPRAKGAEERRLQEQLVNLYVGAGAFGRAAEVQKAMAEATQATSDWRRAGDLMYNWMEQVGQASNGRNPAIVPIGQEAVAAYEEVIEREPDNLDVRTDMATVLLRSNSPMRGVEELNRVLDEDSTFVPARFNKGIALLWIGRLEQAIEQFEQVQQITGEDSPNYQQAEQAIQLVRGQMEESSAEGAGASSGRPAPSASPPRSPNE